MTRSPKASPKKDHNLAELVYGPTDRWPKKKRPPTGPVFDLIVVTLFLVLGIGMWFV